MKGPPVTFLLSVHSETVSGFSSGKAVATDRTYRWGWDMGIGRGIRCVPSGSGLCTLFDLETLCCIGRSVWMCGLGTQVGMSTKAEEAAAILTEWSHRAAVLER